MAFGSDEFEYLVGELKMATQIMGISEEEGGDKMDERLF